MEHKTALLARDKQVSKMDNSIQFYLKTVKIHQEYIQ